MALSLLTFLLLLPFTLFLHGTEWDPPLGQKEGVAPALALSLLEAGPRLSAPQAIARPLLVQLSFRLHSHVSLATDEGYRLHVREAVPRSTVKKI